MSSLLSLSAGKKLFMSLAGIFLLIFLVVHLGINLLVILYDNTDYYNISANYMESSLVVKIFEIILFGSFVIHMFLGLHLSIENMLARPRGYKKKNNSQTSFFSKYILHTSIIIMIFLVLHIFDFYVRSDFLGDIGTVVIKGKEYPDMASLVLSRFKIWWVVIVYIIALFGLGFHLHHGFQSAFQTLGINNKTYTPLIKVIGLIYTIIITLGFILIPVSIYFFK